MTLLEAFARMEGFGKPGTRPTKNNNPGDIIAGKFTETHGSIGSDGRFAIFPTPEKGFAAMAALFLIHSHLTIHEMIGGQRDDKGHVIPRGYPGWAPAPENDVEAYVRHVCDWTHLEPTDLMGDHLELPIANATTPTTKTTPESVKA